MIQSRPTQSIGAARRGIRRAVIRRRIRTPDSQCHSNNVQRILPNGKNRKACRSARSYSAPAATRWFRWCYQSFNWQHGTFLGATLASETTAAATGAVGVVRRDPMAMLPFCGYNMGDYWGHWLSIAKRATNPPKIFRVNWFQRNDQGKFIWPGFGENLRVLRWVIERSKGGGQADETPIGYVPKSFESQRRWTWHFQV